MMRIDRIVEKFSNRIYGEPILFESGTFGEDKWFNTSQSGPIICAKYKVNLLSYDGYESNNSLRSK